MIHLNCIRAHRTRPGPIARPRHRTSPAGFSGAFRACLLALTLLAGPAAAIDLSDPSEPWRRAGAGLEAGVVPPPFEDLTRNGNVVGCWGRSVALTGLFPSAIRSTGEDILAAPIAVWVRSGSEAETALIPGQPELGLQRADRMEWQGRGRAGGVSWRSQGWIEYDGMMRIALTLASDEPGAVDLRLDLPLVPGFELYHAHKPWATFRNELIGPGAGTKHESAWMPYWWLGDDYRGLTFLTETEAGWQDGDRAIQIIREADRLILRAHLRTNEATSSGEQTFVFGLHPTPAKPLPHVWHGRYMSTSGLPGVNIGITWLSAVPMYNYPEEDERRKISTAVVRNRERGARTIIYTAGMCLDARAGVFARNYDEWIIADANGDAFLQDRNIEGRDYQFDGVCVASSYTDWMPWAIDQAMAAYGIDGVYVDNALPLFCPATPTSPFESGTSGSMPWCANTGPRPASSPSTSAATASARPSRSSTSTATASSFAIPSRTSGPSAWTT